LKIRIWWSILPDYRTAILSLIASNTDLVAIEEVA